MRYYLLVVLGCPGSISLVSNRLGHTSGRPDRPIFLFLGRSYSENLRKLPFVPKV